MIRACVLLAAGAIVVSGLALTTGALIATAVARHNSTDALLIVAITVLVVSVGAAWGFSRRLLQLLSSPQSRPFPPGPHGQLGPHERACPRRPGAIG